MEHSLSKENYRILQLNLSCVVTRNAISWFFFELFYYIYIYCKILKVDFLEKYWKALFDYLIYWY